MRYNVSLYLSIYLSINLYVIYGELGYIKWYENVFWCQQKRLVTLDTTKIFFGWQSFCCASC